jgi:ubiquinone/menaquinone biosynthesis C-methylase UbiE
MKKKNLSLDHLHEEVPANYYDNAIQKNVLQKFWHNKRFIQAKKYLKAIKARQILDIGCNSGTFTRQIYNVFPKSKIYGIDISRKAILYAKRKYKDMSFSVARAEKLPFKNKSFDLVTCFEVLEHVDEPEKIIKEILRVLRKKGNLIIIVPTENLLFRVIWALWTKLGPGRVWKHTHVQKFTNNNLDALLKKLGCSIVKRNTFLLGMLLIIHARNT